MPNIFQRMGNWFSTQAAEYRYQRALTEKAQAAESLMRQQEAALARIDRDDRIPTTHKAVAKLAARQNLYDSDETIPYQQANIRLREGMGGVVEARGLDEPPSPRGQGIGAFFGRLFNGRGTEAQRRRQAESLGNFDGGAGFTLSDEEKSALQAYRDSVARERPKGREAAAVTATVGQGPRPRRYRAVDQAAQQVVETPGMNPVRKRDAFSNLYTAGNNYVGVTLNTDTEGNSVQTNQFIPGPALPDGSPAPERDAAYRLGWAGYAIFDKTPDGLFRGKAGMYIPTGRDQQGKVRAEFHPNDDIQGRTFGQISTAGVSACSVVIIRKGDRYAMLHLDAAHTEPGVARDHLMQQMKTTFGDGPGEIEIMESVRGASRTEWEFCAELEDALTARGNTLKVQRVDRQVGKPEVEGFGDEPSGHLEVGITSQDVVFGDRADVRTMPNGDEALHTRPFEWRLSASQETVNALWGEESDMYREFTSAGAARKYADDIATERAKQMEQAGNGIFGHQDPKGKPAPGTQAAMEAAAVEQNEAIRVAAKRDQMRTEARRAIDSQEGRTPPQAEQAPPQAEQAPPQAQQAPPQAEQAPPQAQQAPPQAQQAPPQAERIDIQTLSHDAGRAPKPTVSRPVVAHSQESHKAAGLSK
ncbi:MAG: hypothetical protein LBK98_09155 [Peptococcaceae bacterium]|nr:hypothetical protein [Peptococcaceae bacterium]